MYISNMSNYILKKYFKLFINSIKSYRIYLLIHSSSNLTYVGITNNFTRRLRQHNCELKGGARYTTSHKKDGNWICYGYIYNVSKRKALSLEKKIKIKSRKMKGTPLEKRLKAISILLDNTDLFFINLFQNPTLCGSS